MRNTDKIIALAKEKSLKKIKDSYDAIEFLKSNNRRITFYAVSKQAGVTTQFLYKNAELRKLIEQYRKENSIK